MRKTLRLFLFGLAAIGTLAIAGALLELRFWHGRTPGIDSPNGIASLERQRIGGSEQWILVRGVDRANPVLLFLHGGPGMPAMYLAHAWQADLERDFVVVQWDRRGAGKSFAALGDTPELTVSQTLADVYELARSLAARFGQRRIYLVGHSWGSYLGLLAVRAHPELFRAFIGTGQMAGTEREVRALRRAALGRIAAENGGDTEITEEDLFRFGGELHRSRSFWPLLATGLGAPEYTLRDVLNVKRGADLVLRRMRYDVEPRPLAGEIAKVDVPIFFFLGRYDLNTPSELAARYLDRLDAPLKGLAWFEQSAHFTFYEEPARFHEEMLRADRAVSAREVPGDSGGRFGRGTSEVRPPRCQPLRASSPGERPALSEVPPPPRCSSEVPSEVPGDSCAKSLE